MINHKLFTRVYLFILMLCALQSQAQNNRNFIDRFHYNLYNNNRVYHFLYKKFWEVDTTGQDTVLPKKSEFLVIPFVTYSPESSFKFGAAVVYSFYTHNDRITHVSSQSTRISYSLQNQTKIEFSPDIWTAYNHYHYTGYIYLASQPSNFYGIGYNTRDSNVLILDSRQFFADLEAEKEIIPHFRAGITFTGIHHNYLLEKNVVFFQKYPNLYGNKGGSAFFGGLSLIYDTRNLITFTTRGTYLRLNSTFSPKGDFNSLGQINFSGVQYFPIGSKSTLGFNLIANSIFGDQVPFFLLNQIGGQNIERGYYSGRFRDKNHLAAQAEFKYHFIPRLALAVFAGAGTVWGYQPFSTSEFKPSAGGGIHYLFSVPNQLSLRLDYGVGQKLPGEPRAKGAYFALSEAF